MDISKQSKWKTVSVFISSTFRDMQAERDWLVRFVFPKLREELMKYRIHFVDVDLRWGVTNDQNALGVCREIIDECHPRFLCMLGGRYGWVPDGQDKSITADEIHYGVLGREAEKRGHAFFYIRDDNATVRMVEETPGDFREPDGSTNATKLANLKKAITDAGLNSRIYGEDANWDAAQKRLTGLEAFGKQIHTDLLQSLEDDPELAAHFTAESTAPPEEFAEEAEQMEAFIEERTGQFVLGSREPLLRDMLAFATAAGAPNIFVLTGDPGSGKSAFLAKFTRELSDIRHSSFVIPHFVGASTGSTDLRCTLRRLCHELAKASENAEPLPLDIKDLITHFQKLLAQAAGQRRVILVFDALNQFDATDGAHWLNWLTRELPPGVRIVASVIAPADGQPEHQTLAILRNRPGTRMEKLEPLTEADTLAVIEGSLRRYAKRLSPAQIAALLAKPAGRLPLYVLTALEELRTLGAYEEITDRIRTLPGDARALFGWILTERLARDPGFRDREGRPCGAALVEKFAACLGVSRHGLSPAELTALLDPGDPLGNVAALLRLLRPYLMHRGELLDFYHGQFREAAEAAHLDTPKKQRTAHQSVATCLQAFADPHHDRQCRDATPHALSELPHHQTHAEAWPDLIATLENIFFLEGKVTCGLVFDLVGDFAEANAHLPKDHPRHRILRLLSEALRRDLDFIHRNREGYPQALFQCLWNSTWWYDCVDAATADHATESSQSQQDAVEICRVVRRWRQARDEAVPRFQWLRHTNIPATAETEGIYNLSADAHAKVVSLACNQPSSDSEPSFAAAGHEDGIVRLWDIEQSRLVWELRTDGSSILSLKFSNDNTCLFAFTRNASLVRVDIVSGAVLQSETIGGHSVECAAFGVGSLESKCPPLCFWTRKAKLHILNVEGHLTTLPHGSAKYVSSLCFLGETGGVVLGGIENESVENGITNGRPRSLVRVVRFDGTHEKVNTTTFHGVKSNCEGWVESIGSSNDGSCFVTASVTMETDEHSEFETMYIGETAVWKKFGNTWEPMFCSGRGGACFALALSFRKSVVVGSVWQEGLTVWTTDGKQVASVKIGDQQCRAICIVEKTFPIIVAAEGSRVRCVPLADVGATVGRSPSFSHQHQITSASVSYDLGAVATGSIDETVALQEIRNGGSTKLCWQRASGPHRVSSVAFSPVGQHLYDGGYNWLIRMRERISGNVICEYHSELGRIGAIYVSRSGKYVFAVNADGSGMVILDNALGVVGGPFRANFHRPQTPIACDEKDEILAVGIGMTNRIVLVSLQQLLNSAVGSDAEFERALSIVCDDRVNACVFGHNVNMLVVADERTVALYDVSTGHKRTLLVTGATALALSCDDQLIACGVLNQIVVFDVSSGQPVWYAPVMEPVITMQFSENGQQIIVVSDGSSSGFAPGIHLFYLEGAKPSKAYGIGPGDIS